MHEVQRLEACPQAFAGGMGLSDRLKTQQPLVGSPALQMKSAWVSKSCGEPTGLVLTCMCCALLTLVCPYGNRMAVPVRSAGKHLGVRTHWGGANLRTRGNVRGAYGAPEGPAKGHRQEARRSECSGSCMCEYGGGGLPAAENTARWRQRLAGLLRRSLKGVGTRA